MKISKIRVQNFRAIVHTKISLGEMTALIGANNAGKTTFLLALERLFSDKAGRMKPEDFNDKEKPITITVTLEGVGGEDELEVSCEWECKRSEPDHEGERRTTVTTPKYTCKSSAGMDCKKFLQKYVNVIYVPAEHETDDDGEDKKNSPLEQIINDTIRRIAEKDSKAKKMQVDIQKLFDSDLLGVKAALDRKLRGEKGSGYAPNVEVDLKFKDLGVTLKTDLSIIDCISGNSIDHKYMGHGTKRAFYMAALEVGGEVAKKAEKDRDKKAPGAGAKTPKDTGGDKMLTLIIIDEPELHQHPQRQRLLLQALQNLSDSLHQVVYTTHSPMMITLKGPMDIRKVINVGRGVCVHGWKSPKGKPIWGKMIKAMEEAVFASGAILVEGHDDETIINAMLRKTDHEEQPIMDALVSKEVVVVDCGGKESMVRFYDVLKSLGIRQFVIWDGDLNKTDDEPVKKQLKSAADKRKDADASNKRLAKKIGMSDEFLEPLNADTSDYADGPNCVCFWSNGPTYWAEYFDTPTKELKDSIRGGENIDPKFNTAKFKDSDFYKTVQNIRKYFGD